MASNIRVLGLMMVVILASCGVSCLAKVYTVGDSSGWALSVDYTTWAGGKTFNVGDSLVFNYDSSHTVDEVSSSDYGTCTAGNAIASYNSGATTVALNTTGTHYFICGVPGHCSGGMKLAVPVAAASAAAPSATSPATTGTDVPSSGSSPTLTPPTVTGATNIPAAGSSAAIYPSVAVGFIGLISLVFN